MVVDSGGGGGGGREGGGRGGGNVFWRMKCFYSVSLLNYHKI